MQDQRLHHQEETGGVSRVFLEEGEVGRAGPGSPRKPSDVERDVPYVQQTGPSDCGWACVEMVMRALGLAGGEYGEGDARKEACEWTVNLGRHLRRRGVEVRLFTTANRFTPSHRGLSFYDDCDAAQIDRDFAAAAEEGLPVELRVLRASEIAEHIRTRGAAIVLLCSARLQRRLQQREKQADATAGQHPPPLDGGERRHGYTGHFVVLTGVIDEGRTFVLHDPGRGAFVTTEHADDDPKATTVTSRSRVCVSLETLEHCRHAQGTDDDVLLVDFPQ
eukprot:GHVU01212541.1.p1 GENE.GHVU01212541.1~~GHVU01212541.1.p1  ORF type:complete len:277 (-),score=46.35 GHVU01212541.1:243-1073(-)